MSMPPRTGAEEFGHEHALYTARALKEQTDELARKWSDGRANGSKLLIDYGSLSLDVRSNGFALSGSVLRRCRSLLATIKSNDIVVTEQARVQLKDTSYISAVGPKPGVDLPRVYKIERM